MALSTVRSALSQGAVDQYQRDGFAVLAGVISDADLSLLRDECAWFVGETDARMAAQGREVSGITHRGKRYFISNRYRQRPTMASFLFGETMAAVTQAFLGHSVWLFNEQWVVKGPEQGMEFAWHQDSGYVNFFDRGNTHAPYLTCWCALDDMAASNGTISVLPHARAGTDGPVLEHVQQPGTNDLLGYDGDDPGELIEVSAGSIVVFSSRTLHRSSANTSPDARRAYLAQYSAERLCSVSGDLWGQAVPFVENGQVVYDPEADTAERWMGVHALARQRAADQGA